jgi:hypothetical protein
VLTHGYTLGGSQRGAKRLPLLQACSGASVVVQRAVDVHMVPYKVSTSRGAAPGF